METTPEKREINSFHYVDRNYSDLSLSTSTQCHIIMMRQSSGP